MALGFQLEAEGLEYSGKSSSGGPETCSQFHMRPSNSRYQTSVNFLGAWIAGQILFPSSWLVTIKK